MGIDLRSEAGRSASGGPPDATRVWTESYPYVFDAEGMIEDGNFHFRPILGTRQFYIPAAGRVVTNFNGVEILAALASLFFTGFWFETRFANSVCYEALCVSDRILLI